MFSAALQDAITIIWLLKRWYKTLTRYKTLTAGKTHQRPVKEQKV